MTRVGKFKISRVLLIDKPHDTIKAFFKAGFVIVHCDSDWATYDHYVEYTAIHDAFEPVMAGEIIPMYDITFYEETGAVDVKRCASNSYGGIVTIVSKSISKEDVE